METTKRSSQARKPGSKPAQSSGLRTAYLILYNLVSSVLWFAVLYRILVALPKVGIEGLLDEAGGFLKRVQVLAALEIVHALTGVVRSPFMTTFMQVGSRFTIAWGAVHFFPENAKDAVYTSMVLAWSITEAIRYPYFVFTLSGYIPGFLKWLRYNTFFVLYPIGITCESIFLYRAIAPSANREEFLYGWAWILILMIWIPGSVVLYTHMMSQRKKVMRADREQKSK